MTFLTRLDLFGHSVQANFRGRSRFQTLWGALITISVLVIIFCYFLLRFTNLILLRGAVEHKNTVKAELDKYGPIAANQNRFDFGFGIVELPEYKYVQPDPRFFTLKA